MAQNTEDPPVPRQVPGLQGPATLPWQPGSSMAPPGMLCGPVPTSSPPRMPAKLALEHPSLPASSPPSSSTQATILGGVPFPPVGHSGHSLGWSQTHQGSNSCSAYPPTSLHLV